MLTVVETTLFSSLWPRYWTEDERGEFAVYLATHPDAGDVIPKTQGLRKVRWSRQGSGKSGGVRVIYFKRNIREELVLLLFYAKSRQATMTAHQLTEIRHALQTSDD
jgi:hypothetical protein